VYHLQPNIKLIEQLGGEVVWEQPSSGVSDLKGTLSIKSVIIDILKLIGVSKSSYKQISLNGRTRISTHDMLIFLNGLDRERNTILI